MIKVTHDGEPAWEVAERCCFCRKSTRFWFTPKDVAVCRSCAETVTADQVPSKSDWFAKELATVSRWP